MQSEVEQDVAIHISEMANCTKNTEFILDIPTAQSCISLTKGAPRILAESDTRPRKRKEAKPEQHVHSDDWEQVDATGGCHKPTESNWTSRDLAGCTL